MGLGDTMKKLNKRNERVENEINKAGLSSEMKKGKKKKKKGDPYIEGAGYFTGKGWYKPHRRDRKH